MTSTLEELEEEILLAVLAAKELDASTANTFFDMIKSPAPLSERYLTPIQRLEKKRQDKTLKTILMQYGLEDKHRMVSRCVKELSEKKPDLANVSLEELEKIYGISRNTSSLFLLLSNEDVDFNELHYKTSIMAVRKLTESEKNIPDTKEALLPLLLKYYSEQK